MRLRADVALTNLIGRVRVIADELDLLENRKRRPGGGPDTELLTVRKTLLDACRRAEKER